MTAAKGGDSRLPVLWPPDCVTTAAGLCLAAFAKFFGDEGDRRKDYLKTSGTRDIFPGGALAAPRWIPV